MVGRKANTVGMRAEIVQTERFGVSDQKAEDALPGWARAYPGFFVLVQPDSDELRQASSINVEHAECTVTGPSHGAGFLDHMAEEHRQFEVLLDEQGRLEDPLELDRILDRVVRHKTAGYQR